MIEHMSSLADRVEMAIKYAQTQGFVVALRDIPRVARKLDPKAEISESYVNTLLVHLREDPNGTPNWRKLSYVANVCGVDPAWMQTGEGMMETLTPEQAKLRKAILSTVRGQKPRGRPPKAAKPKPPDSKSGAVRR